MTLTYGIKSGRIELQRDFEQEFAVDAIPEALEWGEKQIADLCATSVLRVDVINLNN